MRGRAPLGPRLPRLVSPPPRPDKLPVPGQDLCGVVAVCGRGKGPTARGLGASEVVGYTETSVGEWLAQEREARQCDLVVGCIGGEGGRQCASAGV